MAASPLIKPDVRSYRIRLTRNRSIARHAQLLLGSPAAAADPSSAGGRTSIDLLADDNGVDSDGASDASVEHTRTCCPRETRGPDTHDGSIGPNRADSDSLRRSTRPRASIPIGDRSFPARDRAGETATSAMGTRSSSDVRDRGGRGRTGT